jgi:transposase
MAKGQKFSDEYKMGIAKRLWDGENAQTVSEELGVHYTTVLDWKSKFKPKRKVKRRVIPRQPTENTRVSDLEKQIAGLTAERDLWKEAYRAEVRNNSKD